MVTKEKLVEVLAGLLCSSYLVPKSRVWDEARTLLEDARGEEELGLPETSGVTEIVVRATEETELRWGGSDCAIRITRTQDGYFLEALLVWNDERIRLLDEAEIAPYDVRALIYALEHDGAPAPQPARRSS